MCKEYDTADQLTLLNRARRAADDILDRCFRVALNKALDLSTPAGFDQAVAGISAQLRSAAHESDVAAVKAAIEILDVDWRNTTPTQRQELVSSALQRAGRQVARVSEKAKLVFQTRSDEVVGAARAATRQTHRLSIATDFNAVDRRIIDYLTENSSLFVLDEYGRRILDFGDQAGRIVGRGLEHGLGRDDIARDLHRAAQNTIAGRSSFYWDVVAGSFIGRGRSFAQLSAFAEARIDRYVVEAVLDEVTTEVCRFLDGKVFSVGRGLDLFQKLETNPSAEKEINPWIRVGVDDNGQRMLYVNKKQGRVPLAMIEESGLGSRDVRGSFSNALSEREMMDLGLGFPPYHGLCRSTTLPVN